MEKWPAAKKLWFWRITGTALLSLSLMELSESLYWKDKYQEMARLFEEICELSQHVLQSNKEFLEENRQYFITINGYDPQEINKDE